MIDSVSDIAGASADLKKTRRQKNNQPDMTIDRLPPYSEQSEQGVLGCCLLAPRECIGECIEKMNPESFYDLKHQTIYDCLVSMYEKDATSIDIITVQKNLKDMNMLDQIGGISYLSQLQDAVPSAANLSYYLEHVREKFLLRKMITTCTDVVGRIYEYEGEVDALMDEVERDILKIGESRAQSTVITVKDLAREAIDKIEFLFGRKGEITGVRTGFTDLDKMTDGMHGGEMIVIAARPSIGKTSISMNIVEHVALNENLPVGVFSMEMAARDLILRMTCSLARVNLRNVRDGHMQESDFPKLTSASGRISKSKIYIDDTAALSVLQLRARARRMHQQYGVKLFVIDYLQLMRSTAKRSKENRQQEIADISSGIKALAKELDTPILVLSQLNREFEKDKKRKPRLSDLRESGAIEQDADVVGLLYKDIQQNQPEEDDGGYEEELSVPVNLLIAKQRNGPTGDVHFTFFKPYTRFEPAAKIANEDVPKVSQRSGKTTSVGEWQGGYRQPNND